MLHSLLLFFLANELLCALVKLDRLSELGIVVLVLFGLQVVLKLLFVLESLLAHFTTVLLHSDFVKITGSQRFFFLLCVLESDLFSVLAELLLLLRPLTVALFLLLQPLRLLLTLLSQLELLVTWVSLLDIFQKLLNSVIELFAFSLALLLVFSIDQSLYAPVRCCVRVVLVCIRELLLS